ncbi:amidohydrolase family protein [Enterocloster clostridioformis]|nr:amidohydrolase family protein [Enterocloster clostridioformis]
MNDRKINTQVISYASDLPATMEKEYAVLLCKEVNDEMYEELRKNPGRFYAFAHLPLSSPEDAAIELERCVKELGFVGAMLSGHYKDMPYDDPFYLLILHIQADEFMIFWIGHFTAQEATKFMMLLNLSLE